MYGKSPTILLLVVYYFTLEVLNRCEMAEKRAPSEKKETRALRRGLGNNGDLETGVSIGSTFQPQKPFQLF